MLLRLMVGLWEDINIMTADRKVPHLVPGPFFKQEKNLRMQVQDTTSPDQQSQETKTGASSKPMRLLLFQHF